MPNMTAGQLGEQVAIQSSTATQNSYGEPVLTWSTVATVWANVSVNRRATDLERFVEATGAEVQRTQYTVTIYYRTDVTERNRLVWGSETLDIEQVYDPDGRKQWLEIKAQKTA